MVTFLYAISHWRGKCFFPANDTIRKKLLFRLPDNKELRGMIGSSLFGHFGKNICQISKIRN